MTDSFDVYAVKCMLCLNMYKFHVKIYTLTIHLYKFLHIQKCGLTYLNDARHFVVSSK